MVDEFFLKSLIQITHGKIRLIDKERDIRRIGQTKEEEDPFFTDEISFNDVLERRPEASIDIFWEDDVYYARVRRKGIQGWILAGPVQTVVGAAPALKIAQKHKIQAASYRLPYCELKTFLEAMKLLLYEETSEKVCLSELYTKQQPEPEQQKFFEKKRWMEKGGHLHNPYQHEQKKLGSIRAGNLKLLEECQNEVWPGEIGQLADNPLRQEKNLSIVVISIACRAAIDGGVAPQKAFSMSDVFISNIERMTQVLPIQAAVVEYEREFARAVEQVKHDSEHNRYVERAKEYVAEHIDESIRVVQIGEALGINENYLTGLFHKYEGITLQHYIRKEKVRQAKELLLYSSYSCSEIAALLCFSTQSHFSSAFKREVGMTPAKYRESKIQRG
ncbi:helix-turn-helix domain-containing protein [Anthropogastromicrobium sp.]|uniref:helix-turn-helix domain-containing protein n=1 Tax=Anthropogastromicrobium sp. TaxID=2981649 RepID=UPI00307AAB2C